MRLTILTLCVAFLYLNGAVAQSPTRESLLRRLIDLPAPAPGYPPAQPETAAAERPDEFYRWKNMPPDDAPLEDLLEYWKGQRYTPSQIGYRRPMTERTAERLLDHLKGNPNLIPEYLGGLPTDERTANQIRDIYRSLESDDRAEGSGSSRILREWLTNNTSDGVSDLSKVVKKIRDRNDYVSNEYQVALQSLARIDWEAARPHVERLEFDGSNPHSQILAYWTRYTHAIAANDLSDIETYRHKLQQVVENRSARWSQRDLAMDALVDGGPWNGRDEWYTSLFADETLLEIQDNGYTGMTTLMNASATSEEWIERFLKMVKSDNKAIRSSAARNLMHLYRDEESIIEALLPWVADPNWAKQSSSGERRAVITALGEVDVPGGVPALISVLSNESDDQWSAAAAALASKKDPRIAPTLRSLLLKTSGELRQAVINALVACGAMSADEQMADLEAYAVMSSTEEGTAAIERETDSEYVGDDDEERPAAAKKPSIPIEVIIGKTLADVKEPDEGLATRAIERAKFLRKRSPHVAARLAEIINGWKGRPIYLELVRKLRAGEADIENILSLLAERAAVREKIPNELASMRSATGITRGIGACLGEGNADLVNVLTTGDVESQIAGLGCGRLLRAKLSVPDVARMLDSSNALLKLAAERYLESEDSLDARKLLLARHPGEARLLGSHGAFLTDPKKIDDSDVLQAVFQTVNGRSFAYPQPGILGFESKLQIEIKEDKNLVAIFGLLPEAKSGQQVIRVFRDRINYTFYDDTARSWNRDLTEKEYKDFYSTIASRNIDGLSPLLQCSEHGCSSGEFIMLGRDGGRRVFYSGYQMSAELREVIGKFESLKTKSDLKLNYLLAQKIKGLEVILADNKFPVYAVWKKDDDLRFLVSDTVLAETIENELTQKIQEESASEIEGDSEDEEAAQARRVARYQRQEQLRTEALGKELSWRTLDKGKLGPQVDQPAEINLLPELGKVPANYRSQIFRLMDDRNGTGGIFANRYEGGLFRANDAGEPVRIKEGSYESPVVSPDKRWVAVTKFLPGEKKAIARINLQTGQEFIVNIPGAVAPISFIPSHAKVLIYRGPARNVNIGRYEGPLTDVEDDGEEVIRAAPKKPGEPAISVPEYYLLDLPTGIARPVKGEFRPIEMRSYRPLQSSSTTDAVWAAIYDSATKSTQIGLYVEKSFSFEPVATFPEIQLSSSDIWVNEKENRVYFVYHGHLLAAPLKSL